MNRTSWIILYTLGCASIASAQQAPAPAPGVPATSGPARPATAAPSPPPPSAVPVPAPAPAATPVAPAVAAPAAAVPARTEDDAPPDAAPGPLAMPPSAASPEPALAPAAAPPPEASAEGTADEGAEGDENWPVIAFHARLLTGFELQRYHPDGSQDAVDETQPEFFLDQAVVEAEVQMSKRLQFELGFNLRNASVRDAFVNYRLRDAVQLRLGRFKRPFSRIELRSRGKLPFRDRGLMNSLVLTESGFAGRALGVMVWGKPTENLRYSLAATNPNPIGSGIEGVDLIARIVYDPMPWLSFGLNALHKWTERFADGPNISVHAVGADARAEFDKLTVTVEFDAAQNPNPPPVANAAAVARTPWALGAIAYADYTFQLSKKWTLAPVVVLEWMDTDTEYERDERVRAVGGLTWNYRKNALRIMPQVEITRPLGDADVRGEVASETYYLLVSTEI